MSDVDDFVDWFRENSWGWYSAPGDPLSDAIAATESVLSKLEFGEIDEDDFCVELANAVRPSGQVACANSFGESSYFCTSENNANCEFTHV